MTISDIVWSVLLAIGGAYELFTWLNKKKGDTASEKVWKVFAIVGGESARFRQARRVALLFIVAWLPVHFLSGGWL